MAGRLPIAKVSPTLVSSSSSSKELEYSRNDIDWNDKCPTPDTSKFSHLTVEEVEITSTEGKLWFPCTLS